MTILRQGTIALALAGSLTAAAGAQSAAGSTSWRAWHGCWSAGAPADPAGLARVPLVCISATPNPDVVQITTIVRDSVTSAQQVDAGGTVRPLAAGGCVGTQVGRWSADRRRVYLSATATCDGATRSTSSILALTGSGDWLDVQGVAGAGAERVRVARYHAVDVQGTLPPDIAQALRDGGLAVQGARVAAGADIGVAAVVEATKAVGVAVAEAFVLERGQRFAVDARQLVALADAGVPSRITDAMIAVSNPNVFAVNRPAMAARDSMDGEIAGRRVYVSLDRFASPWSWGYDPFGYTPHGRGYNAFGYDAWNNSIGYSAYGYGTAGGFSGYGYPYSFGGPVIIVRGAPAEPHGRLVKGRGYEQGDRTATTPNTDRLPPIPARAESRGGSSESTRTTTSGSGSSERTERTAKPRP